MSNKKKPTNFSIDESLEVVWDVLATYRQECIPEGYESYDKQWDDITTAMSWIEEEIRNE